MTKEDIQKKVIGMVDFAKNLYKENKDFAPMFEVVGIDSKGKIGSVVVIFGDNEAIKNRFDIIYYMGKGMALKNKTQSEARINPYAVLFASGAWASRYNKNVDISKVPMPSQDPNRVEIFQVVVNMIEGENYLLSFEIKRGDKIELIGDVDFKKFEVTKNILLNKFWEGYYSVIQKV